MCIHLITIITLLPIVLFYFKIKNTLYDAIIYMLYIPHKRYLNLRHFFGIFGRSDTVICNYVYWIIRDELHNTKCIHDTLYGMLRQLTSVISSDNHRQNILRLMKKKQKKCLLPLPPISMLSKWYILRSIMHIFLARIVGDCFIITTLILGAGQD